MIVPLRANQCGILPQSRLAAPSVHYFILFYFMVICSASASIWVYHSQKVACTTHSRCVLDHARQQKRTETLQISFDNNSSDEAPFWSCRASCNSDTELCQIVRCGAAFSFALWNRTKLTYSDYFEANFILLTCRKRNGHPIS